MTDICEGTLLDASMGTRCRPSLRPTWSVDSRGKFEKVCDSRRWIAISANYLDFVSIFSGVLTVYYRIASLLYLFDLLLHVKAKTPLRGNCPEFLNMPLPCIRELWQPMSDSDWKTTYQEHLDTRRQKGRRGLTLGHLHSLRESNTCGKADSAEELAEWCESVDDLSILLWMTLSVEGE
jgi:hypothetical protein